MNEFQIALAIGALITMAIGYKIPRAPMWIASGAMAFLVSTWWARSGLPFPPFVNAMSDAAVCLAIFVYGQQRWEMGLYRLFMVSVLINITYWGLALFAPAIDAHYAYITALEAINWLALLLILGTAMLELAGDPNGRAFSDSVFSRGLHRARAAAFAQRHCAPWTEVP